jgi:hypothetical protein
MTSADDARSMRDVVRSVLARRAGPGVNAAGVATAVRVAYAELAGVLSPLIGQAGVDALAARAVHLARAEHSLGPIRASDQTSSPFTQVAFWLERQDLADATEVAAAVLANFAELLAAFVGESLTTRVLLKAWPDGFPVPQSEETRT